MPFIAILIIGAAAGFLATRVLRLNTDIPTTMAIGVVGALLGGLLLRTLMVITGWLAGFVGALLGALLLAVLWKRYVGR